MTTNTILGTLSRGAHKRWARLRGAASSVSRWFGPAPRPSTIRRSRVALEGLEDRLVPAVYNVNSLADILNPGPGIVTLRSAIQAANSNHDTTNVINLTRAGTYKITLAGTPGEMDNHAGEFAILPTAGNLTIRNTSGGDVVVDGNHLSRVFDINPGFDPANPTPKFAVTLQGITVQNGVAFDAANPDGPNASGGGIRDNGNASLTLNNVILTKNTASADGGGVVFENTVSVPWTFTVNNSVISNNHAGDAGGGIDADGSGKIFINAGTTITGNTAVNQGAGIWLDAIQVGTVFQTADLTVTGAVVSNNTAQTGLGGGIGNAGNGTVTIVDSTVEHNFSGATGGGFGDENAQGTLVVQNSLFRGNSAVGDGGGIATGGPTTTITNTEITGNSTAASGGGVFANGVTLTVLDSTVSDNTAALSGGGIELQTTGAGAAGSTVTDTTVAGNSAVNNTNAQFGGGIDAASPFSGSLSLLNDTITDNFAVTAGGGVNFSGATGSSLTVQNTIIARNVAYTAGPDAYAPNMTFTDNGGNLLGNGAGGTGFTAATTRVGTAANPLDPMLGSLQNNGGPTVGAAGDSIALETEALLVGSPAIGKGVSNSTTALDERGFVRQFMLRGTAPDIGAYEFQALAPVISSTVPHAGDVNPYGVAFVPANFPAGGLLKPGDLLVSNFNNATNTQGTGTTLVKISPDGGAPTTFFTSKLQGLDDALAVLQAGFVVVGNVPNTDGNGTPGAGALQFLDRYGHVVKTLTNATLLDGPWGLVVNDHGSTVQLFVANVLSGTVTRIDLSIVKGTITVTGMTQIASGYAHRTDPNAFVVGPAGLAYDAASDTLYVASQADDSVYKVTGASTATDHGKGTLVIQDDTHLHGPLGLALTPGGSLLVANSDGVNADPNQPSEIVQYDFTAAGTAFFAAEFAVDPANGGAFGLGLETGPNGSVTLAAVDDVTNTVSVWSTSPTLRALTLTATSDPYQLTVNAPDPTGGPLTYAAAVVAPAAWVQQRYALYFTGSYYQNFLGANEKWLRSGNGSNAAHHGLYLLFPDGTLRAWDGGTSAYSGPLVAALSPSYWANPGLLLHPQPAVVPAGVTAAFLGDSNVLQLSGFGKVRGSFGVLVIVRSGNTTTTQLFMVTITG
jgi:hypothetical protein